MIGRQLWVAPRWVKRDLVRRIDVRKPMHAVVIGVTLASIVAPVVNALIEGERYRLSDSQVLTRASPNLADKLEYDKAKKANIFNRDGMIDSSDGMVVSAGGEGKKSKQAYSATLPDQASTGIEVSDSKSGVGVKMLPQFGVMDGRVEAGHVVYPLKDDPGQLVFTPKGNGLKEDILLDHAVGDRVQYDYKLDVPNSLVAKMTADGGVGFYSGDQSLFGNITYGSDKDRKLVENARKKADKTFLMFEIPAPVVKQSAGGSAGVKARFQLDGSTLSVITTGLAKAAYPLSIDPTFVITTASDFNLGRIEDNITVTTPSGDGQLNRATITGGLIDSNGWRCTSGTASADCTTTVSLLPNTGSCNTTTDYNFSLTAYNGFLYLAGGGNGGSTYSCYVPINSNGTLGTWAATTTTFPTGRTGSAMVGYNGYIYVMGGESANGGTQFTTVEYAPVTTSGDITATWLTASAMGTQRAYFGAVVYNDYIYACGGASFKNNGQLKATCELVNINANGSLGTWTATGATSFTTARDRFSLVAYNNFIYLAGGFDGTNVLSDVQYVSIKSDNTMNAWAATTSLPAVRRSNGIAAEQGHLYLYGGCSTAPACSGLLATTVYAPIHADGTIGTWDSTASITTARFYNGGAAYNGYLYSIGGCVSEPSNNNNCISGNEKGDSQYAAINQIPGDVIAPATANSPSTSRSEVASVAYNGYLYNAGGCNGTNCGTAVTSVDYVQISDDGTLGTWTAGTGGALLPATRFGGAMVGFGGKIWYFGGETSGGTAGKTDVYSATVNSSGVPSWTTESSNADNVLATGRYWLSAAAYGQYIYVTGGQGTSGPFNTVEYTKIDGTGAMTTPSNCVSNGGTLNVATTGHWCKSGNVFKTVSSVSARYGHGTVAYDGYLYIAGGRNGTTLLNDVQRSTLTSADGYPGAFDDASQTALPTTGTDANIGHAFITAYVNNSVLYVAGGLRSGDNSATAIAYAPINSSGNVGTWTRSARTLVQTRWGAAGAPYKGVLYIVGGCKTNAAPACTATNYLANAEYAEIRNGGRGNLAISSGTTWTSQSSPAVTARADFPLVAYNGFLYAVGGCTSYTSGACTNTGSLTSTIYKAALGADGAVGTWSTTGKALPAGRAAEGAVAYNGRLYVMGGTSAVAYTYDTTVMYIPIDSTGDILSGSSWTTSGNSLPTGMISFGATVSNGYVYVAGGYNGTTRNRDVSYAPISTTDGTVGSWTTVSNAFATGRSDLSLIAYNSNLYVIAGYDGSNALGDTQYAPLTPSTGSVGTFKYTTYQDRNGSARQAVAGNGYMYFLGSENSVTDAYYTAINANGTLGNLYRPSQAGMAASTNHAHGGAAFYNGFVYAVGGCTLSSGTCSTTNATVEYTGEKANARVGHYSKLFDTQVDTAPSQIMILGTGQYSAVMRTSGSGSSTLGIAQTVNPMYAGTPYTLLALDGTGANVGIASKYYIFLALDDSQTGAFPDTGSTVTDIYIFYHANPGRRLRHGASFTNTGCNPVVTDGCVLDTAP